MDFIRLFAMGKSSSIQTERKSLSDTTQRFAPVQPDKLDQWQGTDSCGKVKI